VAATWIRLSQPYYNGMPHSVRVDPPSFQPKKRRVALPGWEGETSTTHIVMTAHTGTHIDAARHFYPAGPTLDAYPDERFVGPGVVLDVRREGPVPLEVDELRRAVPSIEPHDIVLLYFGYAERFGTDAYRDHPYLTPDAARFLVDAKVNIVGTDTITPDVPVRHRPEGYDHPVHRTLLGNDVLIIEHLGPGLKQVAGTRVTIVAFPLLIRGSDGAPSAVFAMREGAAG
jgi:arylformamidase